MKKICVLGVCALMLLSLCGCAALLIGGGVAGGIAISKDTAKLEKDSSFWHAWDVTHRVLSDIGGISLQDKRAGKIEADIRDSKVTARITQITNASIRITVKARKNLLPNMDLAVELINKINDRL
jgi:hypothetical protein